jgi:hypothetical protein
MRLGLVPIGSPSKEIGIGKKKNTMISKHIADAMILTAIRAFQYAKMGPKLAPKIPQTRANQMRG